MHSTCIVVLPEDAPILEKELQLFLRNYLLEYWNDYEVEPYDKRLYDDEHTLKLMKRNGFSSIESFAQHLQNTTNTEGIESGLYYDMSTHNQNSRWDYFQIKEVITFKDIQKYSPYSVVDKNKKWTSANDFGYSPILDFENNTALHSDNVEANEKWINFLDLFYKEHLSYSFVILDVHS